MSYLYPDPSNKSQFIQKRYNRIFPLFVTMSIVTIYLDVFSNLTWYVRLAIILASAVFGNYLWVKVIKKAKWSALPRVLFLSFVILQIVVGLSSFWLSNVYDKNSFLICLIYFNS